MPTQKTTSLSSLEQSPLQWANRTCNLFPTYNQQFSTLDIERVCRILIRFAQITEEIDYAKAASLRATQE